MHLHWGFVGLRRAIATQLGGLVLVAASLLFLNPSSVCCEATELCDATCRAMGEIAASPLVVKLYTEAGAMGTGYVIREGGANYVLTSDHLVGASARVRVAFPPAQTPRFWDAHLVSKDPIMDIALLSLPLGIPVPNPPALNISKNIRVGQRVYALGYPLGIHAVSEGRISALSAQDWPMAFEGWRFLLVQAPFDLGSSGGPLVNERGELVGIATAVVNNHSWLVLNATYIGRMLPRLLRERPIVVHAKLSFAYMDSNDVFPEFLQEYGLVGWHKPSVIVAMINPEGARDYRNAKIQIGDRIAALNDIPVVSVQQLHEEVFFNRRVNEEVELLLERNGAMRRYATRLTALTLEQREDTPAPKTVSRVKRRR